MGRADVPADVAGAGSGAGSGDGDGRTGGGLFDAGAQAERTTLSWSRFLLALAANGALLVRSSAHSGDWAAVVGGVILALTLVFWVTVQGIYRRNRGRAMVAILAGSRVSLAVVVVVAGIGLADLAAVILQP